MKGLIAHRRTWLLAVLLTLAGQWGSAAAQEPDWYLTVNVGEGEVDDDDFDESDVVLLYLGYRFDAKSSVEFGFADLGEFDVDLLPDTYVEVDGIEAAVLFGTPLGESARLFGRVGVYAWEIEATLLGVDVGDEDDTSLLLGVGLDLAFNQHIGGRIMLQYYEDIADADIKTLTFGLRANF